MKKSKIILKILSCCFVIVLIVSLLCVNVFAYSSTQNVYDSLFYTPKFDFNVMAEVGWTLDNPNPYNAPKEFVNVPSLNVGVLTDVMGNPDYRYETLYNYYGGAFYGAKVRTQSTGNPNDINSRFDVSMVTYNNMYWDEYGTIYSPGAFGNASHYLIQTNPGVTYGFGGNDIGYTLNDSIEFYFLIPQNPDYDFEEEFDPSSYVDLQLRVSYNERVIYDEGLTGQVRDTTYDESAILSPDNDWLEFYAINYAEDLPLSDDTVVSLDYAVVHCIFYYGRYLNSRKYDVYGNDVDELEGLIFNDLRIGAKMFIDDSAIDFSYVPNVSEEMETAYREFVGNTGNVPIYGVNIQSKILTGLQSDSFLRSIIAESSPSSSGFDPNTELDFVTWLGNTIFGVLRVEFIPGISIANILYVITGLGLLFMIIKYFAGG